PGCFFGHRFSGDDLIVFCDYSPSRYVSAIRAAWMISASSMRAVLRANSTRSRTACIWSASIGLVIRYGCLHEAGRIKSRICGAWRVRESLSYCFTTLLRTEPVGYIVKILGLL